jgi:hypothetical protein
MPPRRTPDPSGSLPARTAAALALSASLLTGCAHRAWFTDTGARPTRLSNPREPLMRVELARGSGYYLAPTLRDADAPYGRPRQYLLVDIGYLNPVVAFSNRRLDADEVEQPYLHAAPAWTVSPPAPGSAFGGATAAASGSPGSRRDHQKTFQLSVPVAFNLYWDPFTENQPILDTDYSFGVDAGLRFAPADGQELRVGAYAGHISTHLGDEYVIAARAASRDRPSIPFDRVNVSYWPIRGSASWRWYGYEVPKTSATPAASPVGASRTAGDMRYFVQVAADAEYSCVPGLKCAGPGYYQVYPGEASPARVRLIEDAWEGSVSLEGRWYTAAYGSGSTVAGTSKRPGSVNAGVTLGARRVFPYGSAGALADTDRYGAALNVVVGYAFPITPFMNARYAQPYVRYYRGPNPYGQFRNQREAYFAGLGVTLTP